MYRAAAAHHHHHLHPRTLFHDPDWGAYPRPSRDATVAMASKRLIKELDAFGRDPSPALSVLEPRSEEDLFHWVAVLRGPEGTAYEGVMITRNTEEEEVFGLTESVCCTQAAVGTSPSPSPPPTPTHPPKSASKLPSATQTSTSKRERFAWIC